MYDEYVRIRIAELQKTKNISNYRLSKDLGRNLSYMHDIHTGKSSPSMRDFFRICEYLDVTPLQFFGGDEETQHGDSDTL